MFQVLVKTSPRMQGSYSYVLEDEQDARAFVERPDVWWYTFPVEDDDLAWHKGGAWAPLADRARDDAPDPLPQEEPAATPALEDEDDGDEDRW